MKRNKSASRCVICGERTRHGRTSIVGRKPSGTPRLLCDSGRCIREWNERGDELRRTWVENRDKEGGAR